MSLDLVEEHRPLQESSPGECYKYERCHSGSCFVWGLGLAYLLGFLLALVSIALLAIPMLRRVRTMPRPSLSLDSLKDVQWQRQQVFDEIRILILDHDLGNLRPDEYNENLGAYRLQVADLLRQEEQLLHDVKYMDEQIEDQILALRMSWGAVKEVTICGECGGGRDVNATLCPRCEFVSEDGNGPAERETSCVEQ